MQVGLMDRGCLLAVQGEGMFGEDYQVFVSDGRAVGQVLLLESRDPAAGGKHVQPQRSISLEVQCQTFLLKRYLFKYIPPLQKPLSVPEFTQPAGLNFWSLLKWQCGAQENSVLLFGLFAPKTFIFLLFAITRFVSFCFVLHLSKTNNWQALLLLINHLGQICLPSGA